MDGAPLTVLLLADNEGETDLPLPTSVKLQKEEEVHANEEVRCLLYDRREPPRDGFLMLQERYPNSYIIVVDRGFEATLAAALSSGIEAILSPDSSPVLWRLKVETRARSGRTIDGEGDIKGGTGMIIASKEMQEVASTVLKLSSFSTSVLIMGESGTGKELIARELHHHSPRKEKAFVPINCGAIHENLIESELFGHKKGAFTDASRDKRGLFEEADGGTIFLDEIGELPLHLQVKLLRALQEQQIRRVGDEQVINIDVRVIAATLRDLELDVREGRFRDDLYYRLNVVSIHIPPLRERRDEIPVLISHFLKKHNKRLGLKIKRFNTAAMAALQKYEWKGNVRELENCVERAMVLAEGDIITPDVLPEYIRSPTSGGQAAISAFNVTDDNLSIKQQTRDLEIALIMRALEKTKGNRTRAAKILEISHRALLYKLKEYGIT